MVIAAWAGLLAASAGPAAEGAGATGRYRVAFFDGLPLLAAVEAEIEVLDGRLIMAMGGGIDHLPNQWATFVEELTVTGPAGEPLAVQARGASGWEIDGAYTGPVRLAYRVDLSFASRPWPPGNEQAGLWRDGALYVVTKPLFIASEAAGARLVDLDLPEGWKASTPWERQAGDGRAFLARDLEDLVDNSIVVGRHAAFEFDSAPFTLVLALVGDIARQSELVGSALSKVAAHMAGVFDRAEPARYLVTLFYAEQDDPRRRRGAGGPARLRHPVRRGCRLPPTRRLPGRSRARRTLPALRRRTLDYAPGERFGGRSGDPAEHHPRPEPTAGRLVEGLS